MAMDIEARRRRPWLQDHSGSLPGARLFRSIMSGLARRLLKLARWMLLSNLILLVLVLVGAVIFHWRAARDAEFFERAILWSTRYILVPASLVEDRGLPATAVQPLNRLIDTLFIGAAGVGPRRDAHLYWQGRLLLPMAATYGRLQEPERQMQHGRRAVAIFADLVSRHPASIDYRRRLARAHDLLGDDLTTRSRHSDALAHYRSALQIAEGLQREEPGLGRWPRYATKALVGIAGSLVSLGELEQSRLHFERAREHARTVPAEFTADAEWRRIMTRLASSLGDAPIP